jgi:hypothetical protein
MMKKQRVRTWHTPLLSYISTYLIMCSVVYIGIKLCRVITEATAASLEAHSQVNPRVA